MLITKSVHGVPIRLTMVHRHPEMETQKNKVLETINAADYIQKGDFGARIAIKFHTATPLTNKHLAVIYKETSPSEVLWER